VIALLAGLADCLGLHDIIPFIDCAIVARMVLGWLAVKAGQMLPYRYGLICRSIERCDCFAIPEQLGHGLAIREPDNRP